VTHRGPRPQAAAVQCVDGAPAGVREAADQPVVAEHDARHLGDVLVALVVAHVATVIHQAGHQVAPPPLLLAALLYLRRSEGTRRVHLPTPTSQHQPAPRGAH